MGLNQPATFMLLLSDPISSCLAMGHIRCNKDPGQGCSRPAPAALPPGPVPATPAPPAPVAPLEALPVAQLRRLARAAGLPQLGRSGRRADLLEALAVAPG